MIDIENQVYSANATALRAAYSGIFVSSEYVAAPQAFPAVTIIEDDNSTFTRTLDSSGLENHASVMFTVNVYSNKQSGRKAECKAIMALIDTTMLGMGFNRVGSSPMEMPNADTSIYRMVARYRATVSKDEVIYRR